jgi:type I restriction enzyme, S subunit
MHLEPLQMLLHQDVDQMRNLSNIRDTVLSRLISGQLRLPEAEGLIEKVA